jgi:hypothetical protein
MIVKDELVGQSMGGGTAFCEVKRMVEVAYLFMSNVLMKAGPRSFICLLAAWCDVVGRMTVGGG